MNFIQIIITFVVALVGSSGFWAFVEHLRSKNSSLHKMILGLGHDRILYLSGEYIKRGYITMDEYDNLVNYVYRPYKDMGGNGTAERAVDEVKKLPIRN